MKVAQSCSNLFDAMDCSPPGSSVRGILQARVLEWIAISAGEDCLIEEMVGFWLKVFSLSPALEKVWRASWPATSRALQSGHPCSLGMGQA